MNEQEEIKKEDEKIQEVINKFPVEIKKVSVNSVFPNKWNPNIQNDNIYKTLVKSIKELGFIVPVLVREIEVDTYEIIDGEHKWKAANELGYTEIMVASMGKIEDSTAQLLTISMNNIRGNDDVMKRAELLQLIKAGQKPLFSLLPMSEKQIEQELALLNFDFSKFKNIDVEEVEKNRCASAVQNAYILDKALRKIHADSNNVNLKLLLEQYFDWFKVFEENLRGIKC